MGDKTKNRTYIQVISAKINEQDEVIATKVVVVVVLIIASFIKTTGIVIMRLFLGKEKVRERG